MWQSRARWASLRHLSCSRSRPRSSSTTAGASSSARSGWAATVRPFEIVKFRTLADAPAHDPADYLISAADPRITRVGAFLRRWSLDELPQLWNVFCGEMSIVGPGPPCDYQVDQYDDFQRRRLEVAPGVTGWAQVSGGTNSTGLRGSSSTSGTSTTVRSGSRRSHPRVDVQDALSADVGLQRRSGRLGRARAELAHRPGGDPGHACAGGDVIHHHRAGAQRRHLPRSCTPG